MTVEMLFIQSILFNTEPECVEKSVEFINSSVRHLKKSGWGGKIHLLYGDGSEVPCLQPTHVDRLRQLATDIESLDYQFFGENLGHGGGQNRLRSSALEQYENETDALICFVNPDILLEPLCLTNLIECLRSEGAGMAEARQIPVEHPKHYDVETGETSWCACACAMVSGRAFDAVGRFDSETFFMYCDDVDLSWRLRLAGYSAHYVHEARVFHDKRLNEVGGVSTTDNQHYFIAEAALLLPYKYSRDDVVGERLEKFSVSSESQHRLAAEKFKHRRATGALPKRIDHDHCVAEFDGDNYGSMRFRVA